ncbi:hypothetical protein FDJ19_gp150 [Vibrio phage Ceto]|uniref:Uncharacterized protein n=1 Tax=Vibrio phage Ceto TaxID=2570300 RepID=A0A2H5BGP9_9CAUD|nr:hypothetical protein FDJ19_gp150 [Vibrio phage Ceto]AUG85148.1 hypothetical protein CETO_166 [Vibrio phage Ceto]
MANIDQFAKKFSMLSDEEKQALLDVVKLDKIKAEFEEHKKSLSKLGYHITSHNPTYEYVNFAKNILEDKPTLHLKLTRNDLGEWRCEISHMIGLVKVTSGEFCYPHNNFSRIFEKQVINVAMATLHLQPGR